MERPMRVVGVSGSRLRLATISSVTAFSGRSDVYFIVGMMKSAPARMPVGQREVTVFSAV
jgi:hypothetical protein